MYKEKMKVWRFELTNAADGWPCHVVCVDREENGEMVRIWSTEGLRLEVVEGDHYGHLVLPGTKTTFVLPDVDEDEGYTPP
jgi:hypothetical protein